MTEELARYAMALMRRVEIKGAEVETWVAVFNALQDEIDSKAEPEPSETDETPSEARLNGGSA